MSISIHRSSGFGMAKLGLIVFGALLGAVNAQERSVPFVLVPDSRGTEASEWSFTTTDPGEGWNGETFDDAAWFLGAAGLGSGITQGGLKLNTEWNTPDI